MARNFTDKARGGIEASRQAVRLHPTRNCLGTTSASCRAARKSYRRQSRAIRAASKSGRRSARPPTLALRAPARRPARSWGASAQAKTEPGLCDFEVAASEQWLKRHVEAKGLRSDYEYRADAPQARLAGVGQSASLKASGAATLLCLQDQRRGRALALRTSDKVLSLVSTIFAVARDAKRRTTSRPSAAA